jgi:tetratricopeptide (TPR) repeat protein
MKIDQCYQLFELGPGASLTEIKGAYRRLARLIHPDLNPSDQQAQKRFVTLNQAYQALQQSLEPGNTQRSVAPAYRTTPTATTITNLSKAEADLKWQNYQTLQELLQQRKFHQAVALVDGLAQRLSQDLDIRQWQGIVYYFLGQHFINLDQLDKAKIYLKKSQKADPQNIQLGQQIDDEYQRIAQIMAKR